MILRIYFLNDVKFSFFNYLFALVILTYINNNYYEANVFF